MTDEPLTRDQLTAELSRLVTGLARLRRATRTLAEHVRAMADGLPVAALPELRAGWLAVLVPVEEALREK